MAKAFKLGDYIKPEDVSEMNTERIQYIDLDLIDPDPENFYLLTGVDDLAENISMVGLLDPLRVRPNGGRYTVESGHRRRAACLLLRDGGNHMFDKGVPCIVTFGEATDNMRRLRLIFANSHTRVLTPPELAKQAEEVTKLLCDLKAQGVELPGRMREHVAEALNVSASKLARVQAIRNNLSPELLAEYVAGRINESVAYRCSQEDAETQKRIWEDQGSVIHNLTADGISAYVAQLRSFDIGKPAAATVGADPQISPEPECTVSGPPRASAHTVFIGAEHSAIDGLKKHLDERHDEDERFWKYMQEAADDLIKHSFAAGALPLRKDNIDMLRLDCRNAGVAGFAADWQGSNIGITLQHLRRDGGIFRTWTEAYDALAAIAITRWRSVICEERKPKRKAQIPTDAAPEWQTGTPPKDGRYLFRLDTNDDDAYQEYNGEYREGVWYFFGKPIFRHMKVKDWWPLPEKE